MTRPERALITVFAGVVTFFSPLLLWIAGLSPPWWLVFVVWAAWIGLIAILMQPDQSNETTPAERSRQHPASARADDYPDRTTRAPPGQATRQPGPAGATDTSPASLEAAPDHALDHAPNDGRRTDRLPDGAGARDETPS